ncbi:MAG: FkbM family methyltransferase [Moorea sp. SIO1F2]|uniref:FkbM family methyltransferase n=1 Tax=Moorena sp. SIO1F2 TaxID=2607819 RepID=UPI0013B753C1|nr:FkbM family methyltransferase [Moorena sp. SIO1F2]NET81447.1 FkbM family methyltransferase [Moorena sp. SIO1F2]
MSVNYADSYWQYLESAGLNLDSEALSTVETSIESTSWDNPTSAIELNNCAVVALIEAEQCENSSLRAMYLEMAFEALNQGIELSGHPLCAAHLALVFAMTGEMEQGIQTAFPTLINTLHPADINEQSIPLGLVYLPPGNDFTDNRYEQLAHIIDAEDGYAQSIFLLSEVLCRSQLVFYNATGLRFIHLAVQLFSDSPSIHLKLGIASLINSQWEGLFNLHQAKNLAPYSARIIQSLYLAYRDLGQIDLAKYWRNMGLARAGDIKDENSDLIGFEWTELEVESPFTYVTFEEQLLLAVEPSLRSLVTSVLIAQGDWFEKEMEFWRNWLQPGMTVIDVGANVGVYTFSAALRVGSEGCVLAVEPFSGCVRCLEETCTINQLDWVKVCAGAASDRNGTAQLALHGASELNEIVSSDEQATVKSGNFEEVSCFTLDSLMEQEAISKVDLFKIDAEGHELQVLAGSNRILTEFTPTILYENIAGSRGSNLAVADFLISKNYQLYQYQPYLGQLIPINSREDLQGRLNIIALPENIAREE